MSALFRQNPIAFVLAAVATVLIAVIALEAAFGLWPSGAPSAPKAAAASEIKLLPPLATVMPDQAYPETVARPLFIATRRPAPAAPTVAGNMTKGQFILQGVIAVGEQRIALLREKSSGKVHRVERGKEISGMTLSVVDNDKVTLAQGGDEEVLTLQIQKAPMQAAAAVPASAGPFGPSGGAGQPIPGMPTPAGVPQPGQPGGPAAPVAAPPTVAQPAAPPATNPAQRSGFGPFLNPPAANSSEAATAATPMTPEELLARRRARRGQQQPNQ
jgi:hypothetical protein